MQGMMNELRETVALGLAKGVGPVTFGKLLEAFGSPARILAARPGPADSVGRVCGAGRLDFDRDNLLEAADREIDKAAKDGVEIITILDSRYPEELKAIHDPPIFLFVKGRLPDTPRPKVTVVGSRQASAYGLKTAHRISEGLAAAGVVVVSGMAHGIDAAAHEGALFAGGITLAVLGGGLSRIYPSQNKRLAARISESGALISELPMDTLPIPENFPVRNRILSGLSKAVVVVEAAEKSGSLITVDAALEQGRDVYAVPGNVDSEYSRGTNHLIRQGARAALCAEDILEELKIERRSVVRPMPRLEGDEEKIFSLVDHEPIAVDELVEKSRLSAARAVSALSLLEIKGYVSERPGKYYVRK